MLGCLDGREVELDDDVVLVADGLNSLRRHARVAPCIGEPVEGSEPRAKI